LRLVAVARLRLLLRRYGVTEVSTTGTGEPTTLRLAPLTLLDSGQLRLKRLYPGAHYRATTSAVQLPIPRSGSGVGSPRIRDLELVQMVADLVLALDGKPQEDVDITGVNRAIETSEEVKHDDRRLGRSSPPVAGSS
jgi:transcription-repair coupling factor (superfamily II helicase)